MKQKQQQQQKKQKKTKKTGKTHKGKILLELHSLGATCNLQDCWILKVFPVAPIGIWHPLEHPVF